MNVPQIQHLHSQNFNSEFVEFVWQFPAREDLQEQVILQVYKNGTLYIEGGIINADGNYTSEHAESDYAVSEITVDWLKSTQFNSPINYIKKFFSLEKELAELVEETVKYLKE